MASDKKSVSTETKSEDQEDAKQRRLERSFAAVYGTIVLAVIATTVTGLLGCIPRPDSLMQLNKIPYWLSTAGTLLGAIGASSPLGVKPGSKWRDLLSVVGWALLLFGSACALLYGSQLQNDD